MAEVVVTERPVAAPAWRTVLLRLVDRDEAEQPRARDEPRHERYWLARQAPLSGQRRADHGRIVAEMPYSLPWVHRSLISPRAPTFETGRA